MAQTPSMTVLEVLNAATGYLEKNGVPSARLNAEHLLAHVLGKKRLDLYMQFDRPVSEAERAPLRELIKARSSRKPLQHLVGNWDFFGRTFQVDARALIPRPETEQLIEIALERLTPDASLIADVGTGSGIIAITLAAERPNLKVIATDQSAVALELAQANAALNEVAERIEFQHCDLLPENACGLNLIAANLPYIPSSEIAGLQPEVQFDPVSALDGGPEGLDLIIRLLPLAKAKLKSGGHLLLEIGHDQGDRVSSLLKEAGYCEVGVVKDYEGRDRFAQAKVV